MTRATPAPMVRRSGTSIPIGRRANRLLNASPRVASATHPKPRLARVTPSWLAERTREIFEEARSAMRASRSPLLVIASRRVRLERTSANSAPTKNALRSTSTAMPNSRPSTDTTYNELARAHQHADCDHAGAASVRGLRLALALIAGLLVVEVVGGIFAN